MEVLHGNQAGSKHSRRRSDQFGLAENRLLNWASHDSDIVLLPHSPLALAGVLSQRGGFLDLIPEPPAKDIENDVSPSATQALDDIDIGNPTATSSTDKSEHGDTAKSSEQRSQRGSRQRFNLLTSHSEADLLRQCKKILVENALVKNKGDRQLYLAAGFISWPDISDESIKQRAPLLLYPALLVRIPDEQRYEIRLAGDSPEYNSALMTHIDERFDKTLPAFDETQPLADFFAQCAESLQGTQNLELEFDIALGSAALLHATSARERVSLPSMPEHFDVALAMSITGNKSLKHLSAVLQLIPEFGVSTHADKSSHTADDSDSLNGAARLRRYAAKLAAEGLDHIEFKQLPNLPGTIEKATRTMNLAGETRTVSEVLNTRELSARELIKLAGIIELVDKAPDNIEQWAHGDLCYASSTILLRRAQHQARLIEDEMKNLQTHFHLDKVPSKSQVLTLINELGVNAEQEPDFVDADYFNARRQFMEFSTSKPASLTPELRRSLSQLAKVLRFRELFVNNVEYRAALGRGYRGLRTDWAMLAKASDYARELAEVLGSEMVAATLLDDWSNFRNSFVRELETIQQAADATRTLLAIVGKRWQTQSVSALSIHANLIAGRLDHWHAQYGYAEMHAGKTAATVLSSFSGATMDHVLIETQVNETQSRILQRLADNEISIDQISDTLMWLTQASEVAQEYQLEIDSIIEHLQIG